MLFFPPWTKVTRSSLLCCTDFVSKQVCHPYKALLKKDSKWFDRKRNSDKFNADQSKETSKKSQN